MPGRRDNGGAVLSAEAAGELLRRIVHEGAVTWSRSALDHAAAERMTTLECARALLGGVCDPPMFESGQWRYRIHHSRLCVVVVFRSDVEAVVVDTWRKQR